MPPPPTPCPIPACVLSTHGLRTPDGELRRVHRDTSGRPFFDTVLADGTVVAGHRGAWASGMPWHGDDGLADGLPLPALPVGAA